MSRPSVTKPFGFAAGVIAALAPVLIVLALLIFFTPISGAGVLALLLLVVVGRQNQRINRLETTVADLRDRIGDSTE